MALGALLHITSDAAWTEALARGVYRAPSLDTEGFIHLSLARQWLATAARFYRGQPGLVLLVIRSEAIAAKVKLEPADGDDFPHLYGELPVSAVSRVFSLALDGEGHALAPAGLEAALQEI